VRINPDTVIQMATQLAYYTIHRKYVLKRYPIYIILTCLLCLLRVYCLLFIAKELLSLSTGQIYLI